MKFIIIIVLIYLKIFAIETRTINNLEKIKDFNIDNIYTISFYQAKSSHMSCHACKINILVFIKNKSNIIKIQDLDKFGTYGQFDNIKKINLGKNKFGFIFTDRFTQTGYTNVNTKIFLLDKTRLVNVFKFKNYYTNNGNVNIVTELLEKTKNKEFSLLNKNEFVLLEESYNAFKTNLYSYNKTDYELIVKIYSKPSNKEYYDIEMYTFGINDQFKSIFEKHTYIYSETKNSYQKIKHQQKEKN